MEMKDYICYEGENGVQSEMLAKYAGTAENVVIPSTFEVLEMECFAGNEKITSVEIPESIKMIKALVFENCLNLKNVKIPSNLYSVSYDAFGDVNHTVQILLTNSAYAEKNGFIINKNNGALLFAIDREKETYTIPENIKYIGMSAFACCKNLKSITIPDSVEYLEMMSFFYCENLTEIKGGKNVSYVGAAAFIHCDKINFEDVEFCDKISDKI